jgi:hypothetical protein
MSSRAQLLAGLMLSPAVLIALLLASIEVWRAERPESRLFTTPAAYSLAEAIERDDVERAYGFIRKGQNPNEVMPASDPSLTAGRTVLVSPLEWAVATGGRNSAMMLLGFGARVGSSGGHGAVCLADALGRSEMAALLRSYGRTEEHCARLEQVNAPLLAFLEAAH